MSCPHTILSRLTDGACPICADAENVSDSILSVGPAQAAICKPSPGSDPSPDPGTFLSRQNKRFTAFRARQSLAEFVRASWHVLEPGNQLEWNWHIQAICDHFQWMFRDWLFKVVTPAHVQTCRNLIINVPPGSLKSRCISVCAPIWAWLHEPTWSVICGSANPVVARRDSDYARAIVRSQWFQETFEPDWQLDPTKDAASEWGNTKGGTRYSKGLNAKVTGQRADCVTGETLVSTELGPIRIDDLCAMESPPRVWSMSKNGNVELRRIVAARESTASGIVRVRALAGNVLRCTHGHKIYTKEGYKEAQHVEGCEVSLLQGAYSDLSGGASKVRGLQRDKFGLCGVRGDFQAVLCRSREVVEARREGGSFLQQGVLQTESQSGADHSRLQAMWGKFQTGEQERNSKVLQPRLLSRVCAETPPGEDFIAENLRVLPYDDGNKLNPSQVLQQDLPKSGAFSEDERRGKFEIKKSIQQGRTIPPITPPNQGAGRVEVLRVRGDEGWEETTCPPHRPHATEQHPPKSDNALRSLPRNTPQIEKTTVCAVVEESEERSGAEVKVYDIQVEGNHNFFANDILVHNCLLIDDPHDAVEAMSDLKRQSVLDRYDTSMNNRVNDLRKSFRLLIMQRLHEDDLAGHLERKGTWAKLCLPLHYDPTRAEKSPYGFEDPRTEQGENLHAARFPPEVIAEERESLGTLGFEGQMEQRPSPLEGNLFKLGWWKFHTWRGGEVLARPEGCTDEVSFKTPTKFDRFEIHVDAAFKDLSEQDVRDKKKRSRVAMIVVASLGRKRFLLDNRTKHRGFKDTCDDIVKLKQDYPNAKIYIEEKANGAAIINTLSATMSGIFGLNPEGGKEARAVAASPTVERGDVYLPDGAPWLEDFLTELAKFPKGANDDQLDAFTQAIINMLEDSRLARFRMLAS